MFNYKDYLGKDMIKTINSSELKGIDLFCGIGGFRIAMEKSNIACVYSSDIDAFAQKTYFSNFNEVPDGDITAVDIPKIPKFDILTAGFPCQPFSYAGKNQGFDDKLRGTLFFNVHQIIKHHRPAMFLLENVKGLKSHKGGDTMETIINSLNENGLGYKVKYAILNSYDFGLPQYRERWYCVGFRDDVDFTFPQGKNRGVKLSEIIREEDNNDRKLSLTKFEIERIQYHFERAINGERIQHDNSKYEPNTKKGKHGIYSYQKPDKSLRFHVGDFAKTQIQEAFYACLNTYAPTIIANRVPKLWDIGRKLSVREAARLQGFPDDFIFPVSDAQAYKQLGNSISVPVVSAIIKEMTDSFKKYQQETQTQRSNYAL